MNGIEVFVIYSVGIYFMISLSLLIDRGPVEAICWPIEFAVMVRNRVRTILQHKGDT